MNDAEIKEIIKNVANNNVGFEFLKLMLDRLGAFEKGVNFKDMNLDMFNRGRREQGIWLLELIRESNFNKFIEIQKQRSNGKWTTQN